MRRLTSLRARTPLFCCAALLLLSLLSISNTFAQDLDDATVAGRVADERVAVVPGALVTATHAQTNSSRAVRTDGEGRYRLVDLPPGQYAVRAEGRGFAAAQTLVEARAGETARLDFTLRPAGVEAETTVVAEAEAAAIDTTRTTVGGTLSRAEVESLPLFTRSPLDLVFLLPGVGEEPLTTRDAADDRDPSGRATIERRASTPEEAGTHSLSGGPAYSNNVTLDGLDNNDDRAARERFRPPADAVEEVQVVSNQFSAEYGRASGGRVNLRTRSGSNQLRGRLSYSFEDESLNANTWNNNRRGLGRLPFQRHAPGFTLGGPVRLPRRLFGPLAHDGRDRTHFFVAYEYDTTLDTALVDALVPAGRNELFPLPPPNVFAGARRERAATPPHEPAELAPFLERVSTPARTHALTARLDRRFGDSHNATLLLQLGRLRDLRQFGGGLRLPDALQGRTRDTDALSFTDNLVLTSTAVNQLRAQWSSLRPGFESRAGGPVVLITIDDPLDASDPAERSGTLVAGSSTSGATERRETRWQLQDTLTFVRGAHALKAGLDAQRVSSTYADLSDATGTYSFTSAGDFLANTPARFRQRFNTSSAQRNLYLGLFAQDEWHARPNLTLTAGLRYERETILDDRDNFAPRLGLAWDPTGAGRTVVRLGAGVFINRVLLRTVDDFSLGRTVVEFDTNDLPAAERRPFIAANLRFPEVLSADSPLVRSFGRGVTDFSRRLDPALRIPESYQLNAGFERELSAGFVFEANYTFNRGAHLWREVNVNAPRLPAGFPDFAAYLLSRDFPNFRDSAGLRPVYNSQTAGDLVRFTTRAPDPSNPDAFVRSVEFGVPVTTFNLDSAGSTTTLEAALAALQDLRPDPARGQVEQIVSAGNSFYHGLTLEARRRFSPVGSGFTASLRAAYTLSRLVDDGVVNTSSALRAGDFRGERAAGLQDRRHRLVLSSVVETPRLLGRLRVSTALRLASGAPFNVSLGGLDRNLDDVSNDRPVFTGDPRLIRSRRPGESLDPRLVGAFSLPTIGRTGDLPRNAGRGPALFTFDLSLAREFRLTERARLRASAEFDNALNAAVFTFGAEFVDFDALGPNATPARRQAFLDSFLVPTRTLRPRTVRLGLRLDF